MVQANDDKHEEAHHRIRTDHRVLETDCRAVKERVAALELLFAKSSVSLEDFQSAPIDVGKIVFNWKVMLTVAGIIASTLGGNWFVNAPVRDSLGTMEKSLVIMKTQMDADTRLQDERAKFTAAELATLKADLKTGLEMRRMEIATVQSTLQQRR